MRIDMNTSVDMLMHSDNVNYIDLDEGELCHWKYIKREKLPNGKWRYYYDESELNRTKADYNKAKSDARTAASEYKDAESKANFYKGTVTFNKKDTAKKNEAYQKQNEAANKYKAASKKAKKLEKKYKKQKLTSFPARTVSKGVVKIANIASGSSKKKKK